MFYDHTATCADLDILKNSSHMHLFFLRLPSPLNQPNPRSRGCAYLTTK